MLGKKLVISLAVMSIFNLSNATVNFDLNSSSINKVYADNTNEKTKEYEQRLAYWTVVINRLEGDKNSSRQHLVSPYFERGSVYRLLKKYNEAIADYTKAVEINPRFADAYFYRGIIYYVLKKYDEAISNFTNVIKIDDPVYTKDAYYCRGIAYKCLGNNSQGDKDIAKARELGFKEK